MGIKARYLKLDLTGTTASVVKVMGSNPRRIIEIKIDVRFQKSFESKTKTLLEKAALTCPVSNSLHPDLIQNISFIWPS
jgi:organic hydroperoxide reductase OsmC/OhrA